jgi:pimeloyl-ACP methyl ester carboxylesterase
MATLARDGIVFHYRAAGDGLPFVFQHGLGGDTKQIFDLFVPPPGVRLITLDCRAHGDTQPIGDVDKLTFDTLADDVVASMDHLQLGKVVIGGISMGAGVALNLALRYPQRVAGLVLSRPAWLDRSLPPAMLVYANIAYLVRRFGVEEGRRRYLASAAHEAMLAESPDVAASLVGQFDAPQAAERIARLERMPLDRPCADLAACAAIDVPVLVLANRQDPLHPFALAQELAGQFKQPEFVEVTAKSVSRERHRADVQTALNAYLARMIGSSVAIGF